MWVKLGQEYLNLDQVVRVKFNKGWKNGQEETVAELEAMVKGEMQVFTRYRGAESATLLALLQSRLMTAGNVLIAEAQTAPLEGNSHAMATTLHDVQIPQT
jgi:hypothetical protein